MIGTDGKSIRRVGLGNGVANHHCITVGYWGLHLSLLYQPLMIRVVIGDYVAVVECR
jgi:hypothetical protein